jgi:heat shock protein HslJ
VSEKEWVLAEIRSARNTIQIDRQKLAANNIGGFFTINFQEGNVSGMGAPNRFRGPYTLGSGNALNIGLLASTLMAAFIEADELKEHEYFAYLSSVTRWALREGRLELSGSDSDGNEVVLVFVSE